MYQDSADSQMDGSITKAILTHLRAVAGEPIAASQAKSWADSVLRLSNHYLSSPDSISPWEQDWAVEALLSYYHPLNQARAEGVARRGGSLGFFAGLTTLVDVGCGSGAAALGLLQGQQFNQINHIQLSDRSARVLSIAADLVGTQLNSRPESPITLKTETADISNFTLPKSDGTLLVLSYVLTEAQTRRALLERLKRDSRLEPAMREIHALAIIEPSTSQDGRRLQALREDLQSLGFHIWAPCTHTDFCPLLKDSDSDWCHDRVLPRLPPWWTTLEAQLPMKNRTVTMSYLLAHRTPPPDSVRSARMPNRVRVIGDALHEKTKVRQMICRGPEREFISWFPSRLKGKAAEFALERGALFTADANTFSEQKGAARSWEYRLDQSKIEMLLKSRPK